MHSHSHTHTYTHTHAHTYARAHNYARTHTQRHTHTHTHMSMHSHTHTHTHTHARTHICACTQLCAHTLTHTLLILLLLKAPKDFDVRLRNGSTHSEGRVDVYYEGEWSAICDNGWDINDATVICRQLGYVSVLRPTNHSAYPPSNANAQLWLDHVACRGNESSIQFCAHSGWGKLIASITVKLE